MNSASRKQKPFHLSLFGGPVLRVSGSPCGLSPLQGSIMALLYGGERDYLTREETVAVLWPEDAPSRARRRLNQVIYTFKKKIGSPPPFLQEGEEVHRTPALTRVDVDDFLFALEGNRFSECVRLLSLGYLRNLEGRVTRILDDWIIGREAVFKDLLRKGAQPLLGAGEERGDWIGARGAAEALLFLDPGDEKALRVRIRAVWHLGGAHAAQSVASDFAEQWAVRCGEAWDPSAETQVLLQRLQSDGPVDPDPGEGLSNPSEAIPVLVGRDKDLSLLRRVVHSPPHQALRGIVITGEAGIGKTRLIKESLLGIGIDGQRVYWASLSEFEQRIPLNPFIEAFRDQQFRDIIDDLDEPWRTVMLGVMPHHFKGDGPIPHAPEIQPESVPRRLFEAVDRLLLRLAEEEPTVLVIEDLQWADDTTLAILDFLFRRWERGRFQILISVRSEEVNRKSTLKDFLETLKVHGDAIQIHLEELEHRPSQELIENVSDRDLDPEEVAYLQTLAGGNPFFLIELTLEYLAGRVDRPVVEPGSLRIPLSIKQVLRRRLSQLSPESERILNAICVHTRPISVANLAKITGISGADSIPGLDQLHQFRLIRNEGTRLAAAHELIRQTVYQELNPSVRAWIHERVARLLLESEQKPPPDELALHFHEAEAAQEALLYAREAASRAEESGAISEALRFLTIAREHTSDPLEAADIIGKMGHLNYLHQNMKEAAPLLEIAAKRKRLQGDVSTALEWELERVEAHRKTGLLLAEDCLEELSRIKGEASAIGEWETLTKALDFAAHVLDHPSSVHKAIEIIEEAELYTEIDSPEARSRAHAVIALNLYFGDPRKGLNAARQAVEAAMETENRDLQLHALNRLMVVLLYQGRMNSREGERLSSAIEDRFGSSGDLMLKFFVKLNRAVWHLEIGELAQANEEFPAAEKVIRGTQATDAFLRFLLNRAELHYHLGDISASRADYDAAKALLSDSSQEHYEMVILSGLGLCALHEGDLTTARTIEANFPDLPRYWTFDPSVIASFQAERFRMRGDLELAETYLGEVADSVRFRFVTAWLKLTYQRAQLLKRICRKRSETLAEEGFKIAQELGLSVRAMEFERTLSQGRL